VKHTVPGSRGCVHGGASINTPSNIGRPRHPPRPSRSPAGLHGQQLDNSVPPSTD
jgi:hypothetical protein